MSNRTKQETRDDLHAAAIEQFVAFGFQDTSHADIAAAADIARTTFYEYFASTEALLVEIVEARIPELVQDLVASVPAAESPDAKLAGLVVRMVEFVALDDVGRLLHTEVPRLSDGARQQIAIAHSGLSHAFAGIYEEGCRTGHFRELPGRLVGGLLNDVVMAAARALLETGDPKQHVHEYAEAASSFLLRGLQLSSPS